MHKKVAAFCRQAILDGLRQLDDERCTKLFKQMYANGKMDSSIEEVVRLMPDGKLENAMDQVDRTLVKRGIMPTAEKPKEEKNSGKTQKP